MHATVFNVYRPYESKAAKTAFAVCLLAPLTVWILATTGWLRMPAPIVPAEKSVTVLKIMPAPQQTAPVLPVEEYAPKPIEAVAPIKAHVAKPAPVENAKPKPAVKPANKPAKAQNVEPAAPVQQAAAPNTGLQTVKAAGPPLASQQQMSQGDYDRFLSAFITSVRQKLYYPKAAQKTNLTGMVKVSIVFDANGHILSYQLAPGVAGHKLLTEAALKTIGLVKAGWKPPLAPGYRQTIVVPVVFELK